MSVSELPPKAQALREEFLQTLTTLRHKKNNVILSPTAEHRARLSESLIRDLVSIPHPFLFDSLLIILVDRNPRITLSNAIGIFSGY